MAKNTCLPMQEMQETPVQSLEREDPLEEEMATHSGIPAWRISRIEGPGGCSPQTHKKSDVTYQLSTHVPYIPRRLCPYKGLCIITQIVMKYQLASPGSRIFLPTLPPE